MSRADRVADRLAELELDALLVVAPANLRYLTGFGGSNALAVVGPGAAPLRHGLPLRRARGGRGGGLRRRARRARAARHARQRLARRPAAARLRGRPPVRAPAREAARGAARRGSSSCPPAASSRPCARSRSRTRWPPSGAAAQLADEAVRRLAEDGLIGRTGARGRDLDRARAAPPRRRGGRLPAHRRLGRARRRSRTPSRRTSPSRRTRWSRSTSGARLDGYCSDCTRTWATGAPGDELLEAYDVCLRAQRAALAALRPGMTGQEADAVARDLIAEAGLGELLRPLARATASASTCTRTRACPRLRAAARGGQRRHRRAGHLPARARRRADRGPRRPDRRGRRGARRPAHGLDHRRPELPSSRVADQPIPGAMELRTRIPMLRRAAMMAALVALAAPATAGAAPNVKAEGQGRLPGRRLRPSAGRRRRRVLRLRGRTSARRRRRTPSCSSATARAPSRQGRSSTRSC